MYAAHHDVLRVLHAMAKLDPEGVGQALGRAERSASTGWTGSPADSAERGSSAAGLTRDRAAHLMWILASFDAYDLLASGRGLRPQEAPTSSPTAEGALLG